jgi:hypothetical protein
VYIKSLLGAKLISRYDSGMLVLMSMEKKNELTTAVKR